MMDKDRRIDIMGIVNLTDDSFYAGSRCPDAAVAVRRISEMVQDGVDIIDLGACSSRPGSEPVGSEEEWRRLEPVLLEFRKEFPGLRLSVDTYWSEIVERAYDLVGHLVVNDISSGEHDPEMLPLVGRLGLSYIAMHKRGTSVDMQSMTVYNDVTDDVLKYFKEFSRKADENGIKEWILDPGFGFAKTTFQNYRLLKDLQRFKSVRCGSGKPPAVLVGVSRKSMIYKFLDIDVNDSLPATQVLHMSALQNGADILRVHDVSEARRTVALYRELAD